MPTVTAKTFREFRQTARVLLAADIPPEQILFRDGYAPRGLFHAHDDVLPSLSQSSRRVPPAFLEVAERVACHRDESRWELLYRILWRLTHGENSLLEISTDDDVYRLKMLDTAVRRDAHKLKAFVRFRRVELRGEEHFIAWHRPDHHVLPLTSGFFVRRFPEMRWSILTPDVSVHWDLEKLHEGPGVPAAEAPSADQLEDLWKTYYGSIFNPARIKIQAMKREMPVRYWKTLPETQIINELLADAPRRVAGMIRHQEGSKQSARDFLPSDFTHAALCAAAAVCQGCALHKTATQTVFGEGLWTSRIMLVGEQPGDQEDLVGKPFVGPAGQVLDDACRAAGLDRSLVYVTNVVKHFKFEPTSTRRLHKKPDAREISACRPWLDAEIQQIRPRVIVCLGVTAAQTLIGRDFRIHKQRGQWLATSACDNTIATYHPSAILRANSADERASLFEALIQDLRVAAERSGTSGND